MYFDVFYSSLLFFFFKLEVVACWINQMAHKSTTPVVWKHHLAQWGFDRLSRADMSDWNSEAPCLYPAFLPAQHPFILSLAPVPEPPSLTCITTHTLLSMEGHIGAREGRRGHGAEFASHPSNRVPLHRPTADMEISLLGLNTSR